MTHTRRWMLPWTEIAMAYGAAKLMRLGRWIERQGSKRYPFALQHDLRVRPWLWQRIKWPSDLDLAPMPKTTASEALDAYRLGKFGSISGDNRRVIDWHAAAVQTAQKFLAKQLLSVTLGTDARFDDGAFVSKFLYAAGLPHGGPTPIVVMLWKGRDGEGGAQVMSVRGGEG